MAAEPVAAGPDSTSPRPVPDVLGEYVVTGSSIPQAAEALTVWLDLSRR